MVKKSTSKKRKSIEFSNDKVIIRKTPMTYGLVAIALLALLLAASYGIYKYSVSLNNQARLSKIVNIYNDLQMEGAYRPVKADVFGDKRVYEWDKGRTYSSSVQYAHEGAPTDVRADMRKKAEAAGFKHVQTEYEGSVKPIDQYKNDKGNYMRVGVTSKYIEDKFTFGNYDLNDPLVNHNNEAPSYVEVKVNLDDNNE